MDFGSDGLERELKHMKKQMMQKDIQVESYQNEIFKLKESSTELKLARDDALYKLQLEAEKANKNEVALAKTTKELQNYKIQLANADRAVHDASALAATSSKEVKQAELRWEVDGGGLASLKQDKFKLEEKIRSLEKETGRMREELEDARSEARIATQGAGGGFGSGGFGNGGESSRNGNPKAKILDLENQVLALKSQNKKLEEESRSALLASSASSSPGFFGSPPPQSNNNSHSRSRQPSPSKSSSSTGNRRRSTSLTSTSTITALEAQISSLELALSTSEAELEPLKLKLTTSQRLVLRLENEKMALERNVKREMDAISSRLEEAEEERDGLRVAVREGSSAGAELEKVKKGAERERERLGEELRERAEVVKKLEGRVGEIEDEVERGREEVRRREETIKELEVKEKKLEREIAAAPSPPPYPTTRSAAFTSLGAVDQGKHDEMVSNYQSRIVDLEEKLSSSLAASTAASISRSGSDKSLHSKSEGEAEVALQRMAKELKRLKRDKQTLEDDLAASDEAVAEKDREILSLRNNVPLPSSPTTRSSSDLDNEDASTHSLNEKIAQLEQELSVARSAGDQLRSDLAKSQAAIDDLEREVQDGIGREESTKSELRSVKAEFEIYKGEMEAFTSQRNAFEADLSSTQKARDESQAQVAHLTTEVTRLTSDLSQQQKDVLSSSEKLNDTVKDLSEEKTRLEEVVRSLESKVAEVASSEKKVEELEFALRELGEKREKEVGEMEGLKEAKRVVEEELAREKVEGKKLEDALEVLEEERAKADGLSATRTKKLEEEKESLDATVNTLQLSISNLQDETTDIRLQLSTSQAAATESLSRMEALEIMKGDAIGSCIKLEGDVERLELDLTRLQDELRDRSTASEADDRDNQLIVAREQIDSLRMEIERIKKDSEVVEEEHRQVVVELRASVMSTKEELKRKEEEVADLLEKKELELLQASSSLEAREREIANLVEAARVAAEEASAAAAASLVVNLTNPTVGSTPAGYQPSPEELEGILRLQDAVARLRGERNALSAEKDELRSSLAFSSDETESALAALATVREELEVAQQTAEESTSAAIEALHTSEDLQSHLDASEATLLALQTSSAELVQQLEASNSQLVAVQEQLSSAQVVVETLQTELAATKGDVAVKIQEIEELKRERDALEEKRAHFKALASSSDLPVEEALVSLRKEMAEVEARLQRRNETVKGQQHEITRQKAQIAMSEENLIDLADELKDSNEARNATQVQLDAQLQAEEDLKIQLQIASDSIIELQSTLSKATSDLTSHETELASMVVVVFDEKAKVVALTQSLASSESKVAEVSEQVDVLTRREFELSEQVSNDSTLLEQRSTELAQLEERIASLTARESELVEQVEATRSQLNSTSAEFLQHQRDTEERIGSLTRREEEVSQNLQSTTDALETVRLELEEQKQVVQDLEKDIEEVTADAGAAHVEAEEKSRELQLARQEVESLNSRFVAGSNAEELLLKEKDGLQADVAFFKGKLEALQSEYEQLTQAGVEQEEALQKAQDELDLFESCRTDLVKAEDIVTRLIKEGEELRATVEEKEGSISGLRRQAEELESVRGDQEASTQLVQSLRGEQDQLQAQLADVQEELRSTVASKEESLINLAQAQESESSLRQEVSSHSSNVESLLAQVSSLQTAHDSLVESEAATRSHIANGGEQLSRLVEDHAREVASLRTQVDSLSAEIQNIEQTKAGLLQSVTSLETELQSTRASLAGSSSRLESNAHEYASRGQAIEALRRELEVAESELAGRDGRVVEIEEAARRLEGEKTRLTEELASSQRLQQVAEDQINERDAAVARALADSTAVKNQLVAVEDELNDLRSRSSQQEALYIEEVGKLQAEIQEAQAHVPSSGSGEPVDMEMFENQRLLLEQKSMEVEEADDRLLQLHKDMKRVNIKHEKLVKKQEKTAAALSAAELKLADFEASKEVRPTSIPDRISSPVIAALSHSPSRFTAASSYSYSHSDVPPARRTPSLFSPTPNSSSRPIASSRRVSGERAPPSSILSPGVAPPSRLTYFSSLPSTSDPSFPSITAGTKRSRPQELEQQQTETAAILPPAAPSTATPRRALLHARRTPGGGGFTPNRAALRPVAAAHENGVADTLAPKMKTLDSELFLKLQNIRSVGE